MIIYFNGNEGLDLYKLSVLLFCAEWWNKSVLFRLYSECVCFHFDDNNMPCLRVIFEKCNFIENFHFHLTINNIKCVKMARLLIPSIKRFQKFKIEKLLTVVQWLAMVQRLASYPNLIFFHVYLCSTSSLSEVICSWSIITRKNWRLSK